MTHYELHHVISALFMGGGIGGVVTLGLLTQQWQHFVAAAVMAAFTLLLIWESST